MLYKVLKNKRYRAGEILNICKNNSRKKNTMKLEKRIFINVNNNCYMNMNEIYF